MKCSIATWIDTVRAGPCLWFMPSKREYLFSFVIYCHLIHIMHTPQSFGHWYTGVWIMSLLLWRTLIFFSLVADTSFFFVAKKEWGKNLIRISYLNLCWLRHSFSLRLISLDPSSFRWSHFALYSSMNLNPVHFTDFHFEMILWRNTKKRVLHTHEKKTTSMLKLWATR